MKNTSVLAAHWTEFLASRPEFPEGDALRAAFRAGKITRLCDCGCNSFTLEVPDSAAVPKLAQPGKSGAIFEISFLVDDGAKSVELVVFVDKRGHFAGVDAFCCANSCSMPELVDLVEPPFHASGGCISDVMRRQGAAVFCNGLLEQAWLRDNTG